jgi:cytochrome c peroxidase
MKTKIAAWGVVAATAALCGLDSRAAEGPAPFTPDEVRAILSLGPWPAQPTADASNRVSGKREAIELGEKLFFDERMSAGGRFSCGSCHVPERNWTDNRTRGAAVAEVDRNTPTLMNVRLGRWFGWDGAADSLWSQSIRPMLDVRELGATPHHVAEIVRRDPQMACRYRNAFGTPPSATDDETVLVDAAKALAAFQETFVSPMTPFDRFRDALARGEPVTPWLYSEPAQRGLKIFVGKGQCATCHSGPNFTSGEFRDNGFSALAAKGRPDPGRMEGLQRVRESRFNRASAYNDDPARTKAEDAHRAFEGKGEVAAFKVPTLRHLLLTAPYGHHGELATLADVVRHYSERGAPSIGPLKLTATEQTDLVVFLESVSTMNNPWRPEDATNCK